MDKRWLIVGAVAGLLPACRCGGSTEETAEMVARTPLAPPPTETRLPAQRPKPFAVTFRKDAEGEALERLRLADDGALQASERGRRHVKVTYSPHGPLVDGIYGQLRDYACDLVETKMQRGTEKLGTMLNITAGKVRVVINNTGMYDPEPAWAGAYQGCERALTAAFPDPGSSGHAELELRFPHDKVPTGVVIDIDLGPDHRGLEWRDDDATAVVYSRTLRPVDLEIRAGKKRLHEVIDLETQRGIDISFVEASDGRQSEIEIRVIDDPAKTRGDVTTGTNARLRPLGEKPKPQNIYPKGPAIIGPNANKADAKAADGDSKAAGDAKDAKTEGDEKSGGEGKSAGEAKAPADGEAKKGGA